jgi:hypothetical protein
MRMRHVLAAGAILGSFMSSGAMAQGFLVSTNGLVAIGVAGPGNLDTNAVALGGPGTQIGPLGIAYNFGDAPGIAGRTGWQDALSPGCLCEGWGVAGNGVGSFANGSTGISGIAAATVFNATSITTTGTGAAGLSVSQVITRSVETATGGLFRAEITISNTTGATVTDVRYARAMDWDVPPREFSEWVKHQGVSIGGSSLLLRATNDGFESGDPITGMLDGGRCGATPNTNGIQNGVCDHGSHFIFGFGDLADGASVTFQIFYGAGRNEDDADALITAANAELSSYGYNSACTGGSTAPCTEDPVYIFAFGDVGLPPIGVPAPAGLALFGLGLLGLMGVRRLLAA